MSYKPFLTNASALALAVASVAAGLSGDVPPDVAGAGVAAAGVGLGLARKLEAMRRALLAASALAQAAADILPPPPPRDPPK